MKITMEQADATTFYIKNKDRIIAIVHDQETADLVFDLLKDLKEVDD